MYEALLESVPMLNTLDVSQRTVTVWRRIFRCMQRLISSLLNPAHQTEKNMKITNKTNTLLTALCPGLSPPLSFFQAGCPSCRPTNSVKAVKAVKNRRKIVKAETKTKNRQVEKNWCQ